MDSGSDRRGDEAAGMSTDVVVAVGTGEGICSSRQQVGAGCEGS